MFLIDDDDDDEPKFSKSNMILRECLVKFNTYYLIT